MDQRLDLLKGHQVANVTLDDVPVLAKAMTACLRGRGLALSVHVNDIDMVHLYGTGFDLYVRGEDWLKIAPYLADGTLNTNQTSYPIPNADPRLDVSTIDLQDQNLYRRVYGLLQSIFPIPYPRTNI